MGKVFNLISHSCFQTQQPSNTLAFNPTRNRFNQLAAKNVQSPWIYQFCNSLTIDRGHRIKENRVNRCRMAVAPLHSQKVLLFSVWTLQAPHNKAWCSLIVDRHLKVGFIPLTNNQDQTVSRTALASSPTTLAVDLASLIWVRSRHLRSKVHQVKGTNTVITIHP